MTAPTSPRRSGRRRVRRQRGEILLQARQVTKRFGGLVAVRDIDLDIPQGGIVSIIGPNGAGKTTFFNVVAGIIDPTAGTVAFKGTTLISRPRRVWLESVLWVVPALARRARRARASAPAAPARTASS